MTRKNRKFNYRLKKRTKIKIKARPDLSYGRTLNLGCFVAQSQQSDAHAVYLSIDRGRGKETQLRLISAHANVLDAWKIAVNGTAILESSRFKYLQTNNAITKAFIYNLVETYGYYSSDDAQYRPVGDPKVLLPWLLQGGSMKDEHIPDGISFEVIKPPVTKKWKIYRRKSNHPDYAQGMYAIGFSDTEVLMIENTDFVVISNAYVLAGYIADYLNDKDHSERYLGQSELDRLYGEAQTIFSVELNTVNLD